MRSETSPSDQASASAILRLWHRFRVWLLDGRIRRQHRQLVKYVRRSAYEIAAWKQDIGFLEEQLEAHRCRLGMATEAVDIEKVVLMDEAEADGSYTPKAAPRQRS